MTQIETPWRIRDACVSMLVRRGVEYDSYLDLEQHLGHTAALRKYRLVRSQFAEANMGLVHMVARRRSRRDIAAFGYDDLVQEGCAGLLRAIDLYQPNQVRFSTYAVYWVKHCIGRALENKLRLIRVPSYQLWKVKALLKKSEEDLTPKERETVWRFSRLERVEPIIRERSVEAVEPDVLARATIPEAIQQLDERSATIVSLHFGFTSVPHSLQEIGDMFGISRQRASQLLKIALSRLQRILEQRGITE